LRWNYTFNIKIYCIEINIFCGPVLDVFDYGQGLRDYSKLELCEDCIWRRCGWSKGYLYDLWCVNSDSLTDKLFYEVYASLHTWCFWRWLRRVVDYFLEEMGRMLVRDELGQGSWKNAVWNKSHLLQNEIYNYCMCCWNKI